jgi:hypothetical protein
MTWSAMYFTTNRSWEMKTMEYANPVVATIQFTHTPQSKASSLTEVAYVGAFNTTAAGFEGGFESWCVDIFQNTYFNQVVTDYQSEASGASLGTKLTSIQRLAAEALGQVHDAGTSAAFQMAIWEILNEEGSSFSLSSGNFLAYNASNGNNSVDIADEWLRHLESFSSNEFNLTTFVSPTRQDLVTFTKVPEPATLATFGIGLIGLLMARRKFLN